MNLPPNEIHVWLAFDRELADEEALRAFAALLEPAERDRAARLRAEHLPAQYLVTRALQRMVLTHYVPAVEPGEWRFEAGENGKPRLARAFESIGLHFNLAHTSRLVAMAVARQEVGVDAEHVTVRAAADGVMQRYFTARERSELAALPDELRPQRFFAIWSLKEAWIKATGEGLASEFQAVSFGFGAARRATDFAMAGGDAARWGFWQGAPSEDHVLSLAMPQAAAETKVSAFLRSPGAALRWTPAGELWRLATRSDQEQRSQA